MERLLKTLMFDPAAFEDFESSAEAVAFGIIVVFLSGALAGVGAVFTPAVSEHTLHTFVLILLTVVIAFVTWFAWAGLSYLIGTKVLRGEASYKLLFRNLGFAYIPALLSFLLVVPAGLVVMLIILLWMAGIGTAAVISAEKFGYVRAIATTVLSWTIWIVVLANALPALRIVP